MAWCSNVTATVESTPPERPITTLSSPNCKVRLFTVSFTKDASDQSPTHSQIPNTKLESNLVPISDMMYFEGETVWRTLEVFCAGGAYLNAVGAGQYLKFIRGVKWSYLRVTSKPGAGSMSWKRSRARIDPVQLRPASLFPMYSIFNFSTRCMYQCPGTVTYSQDRNFSAYTRSNAGAGAFPGARKKGYTGKDHPFTPSIFWANG